MKHGSACEGNIHGFARGIKKPVFRSTASDLFVLAADEKWLSVKNNIQCYTEIPCILRHGVKPSFLRMMLNLRAAR
jgi:hypothetical protein